MWYRVKKEIFEWYTLHDSIYVAFLKSEMLNALYLDIGQLIDTRYYLSRYIFMLDIIYLANIHNMCML